MATPDFRLQPLLDHKRQQEEQKTLELSALTAEEHGVIEALAALKLERQAHLRALESLSGGGPLDPVRYEAAIAYLERLDREIAGQMALLDEVTVRVDARREELVEILKEKRSLERLRERHEAEAAGEEARREARRVDEITSSRHARRLAEGRS